MQSSVPAEQQACEYQIAPSGCQERSGASLRVVPGSPQQRRAYLITTGVNANQSPNLNLDLAISRAEAARSILRDKLRDDYGEVIEIPLYSDLDVASDQILLKTASKADLRAVLDLLAGCNVEPTVREEVDRRHLLQAATLMMRWCSTSPAMDTQTLRGPFTSSHTIQGLRIGASRNKPLRLARCPPPALQGA